MHPDVEPNKTALLALVQGKVPDAEWIGVTGSAASQSGNFTEESDIDVLVIHPYENRFLYGDLMGREVEIHQYSKGKIEDIKSHPEWFGINFVWEYGKFKNAEHLFGTAPNLLLGAEKRMIALLGAIGMIQEQRQKQEQGRIRNVNLVRELAALKCLVDEVYPISFVPADDGTEIEYVDNAKGELEGVLRSGYGRMLFYPEHIKGFEYLCDRWDLGVEVPGDGTIF